MGRDKLNSVDHYIHSCGQESLGRNGIDHLVDKRDQNAVLGSISKMTEWSWFVSKENYSIPHHFMANR